MSIFTIPHRTLAQLQKTFEHISLDIPPNLGVGSKPFQPEGRAAGSVLPVEVALSAFVLYPLKERKA